MIVIGLSFLSLPGISTLVPGGYVEPSGFLGVTTASPFGFLVISISTGCSVVGAPGIILLGVSTLGTSSVGLPGSVILPVPGTFPSGNSLFGTVPLPSSPIVTVIGWSLSLPGISTLVPGGYIDPSGLLGVTVTSPVFEFCSNSTVGVLRAGVVTSTGFDGFLLGSVTVPVPGTSFLGRLSFGTSPEPLSPIVTVIVIGLSFLSLPGISTLVPGGYVEPSGFLGVTTASPFGFLVISISTGCSVVGAPGIILLGVSTLGTSSVGLPGSVILPVPGTFPSGNSLFGTVPLPSSPIVTVIGWSLSLPGISTLVPGGYIDPSGLLGVTVTSPVFEFCSNSTVGVSLAGVVTVTFTGTSSFDPSGYVTVTLPVILSPGFASFGIVTITFPLSSTVITPGWSLSNVVPPGIFLPFSSVNGISTLAPGFPFPSSYFGV